MFRHTGLESFGVDPSEGEQLSGGDVWDLRNGLIARGIQVEVTASHFVDGRREGRNDIIVQCTELTTEADADALVDAVAQLSRSGETVATR